MHKWSPCSVVTMELVDCFLKHELDRYLQLVGMREYSDVGMIVSPWTPWPPPVVKFQVFPCNSHWFYAIVWFWPTQSIIFHYHFLNYVQHLGLTSLVFFLINIRTTSTQNSESFPDGLSQNEKLKTWKRSLFYIFDKISSVQSCVTRVSTKFLVCLFAVSLQHKHSEMIAVNW